jgi:hypothetical protein
VGVKSLPQTLTSSLAINLAVLLVLAITGVGSESAQKIDLQALLSDPAAMEKLVVEYRPDMQTFLFVYGTGRVIKQAHSISASNSLVPTCSGKIGQDEVRELVKDIVVHRFFDLPIRSFVFATASDDFDDFLKELKLHSIVIDDGSHRAQRDFAEGIYNDKKEFIPMDFSTIEEVLRRIEKSALGNKPCTISPGVRLPPVTSSGVLPASRNISSGQLQN